MSKDYRTTDLSLFQFEGRNIRTFVDEHGMTWWIAADVCATLEMRNVSQVCKRLDADEKGLHFLYTLGGPQENMIVNEPGLYKLLLRSNKKEAKAFQRWVTHEVLPQVRRTGTYTVASAQPGHLIDTPYEFTVSQVLCFWEVYTHPATWYTTDTLAQAAQISVRRVRDYCRFFADQGVFERVHWHPMKQYRWHDTAPTQAPALVQAYVRAFQMLPGDLPLRGSYPWERDTDPRTW